MYDCKVWSIENIVLTVQVNPLSRHSDRSVFQQHVSFIKKESKFGVERYPEHFIQSCRNHSIPHLLKHMHSLITKTM